MDVIMFFAKKKKAVHAIPTKYNGTKLIKGMGALFEWTGKDNVLAYFKDGAVYSDKKAELGTYSDNGDFKYDGKIIGSYSPSDSGGIIYLWENYPSGMQKVAEFWNGQEYIHPDDESVQTIVFKGDPVGAAAAFVILYYGYGKQDSMMKQRFLK